MQKLAAFMKSSAKIHLVCQNGLGKPLWARVFKACCCNSDYCVRYCDADNLVEDIVDPCVATVITASGIVTLPQSAIPDNAWPLQQR